MKRPRINNFGVISWNELHKYLTDNYVWMLTVSIKENTLVYHGEMMFRNNKRPPEKIYITVSQASKNVISAESEYHGKFNTLDELIKYTKRYS